MSEEKKEEKADPMLEMMQRIRSGNVNLKKVAPVTEPDTKGGGVMAEMAKLLVSKEEDNLWQSALIWFPRLPIAPRSVLLLMFPGEGPRDRMTRWVNCSRCSKRERMLKVSRQTVILPTVISGDCIVGTHFYSRHQTGRKQQSFTSNSTSWQISILQPQRE